MQVQRIHDGLWRWSVIRDGHELASAYLEHGDAMLLVDPVLPAPGDERDRFERAIARDVARLSGPRHIVVTTPGEARDAVAVADMTGATVWRPGDDAPPGIEVHPAGEERLAVWSAARAALMPGHAIAVVHGRPVAESRDPAVARLLALPARVVIPSAGPMWVAP